MPIKLESIAGVFSGRPLFPYELDLAVVGKTGRDEWLHRLRFDKDDVFYRLEWIALGHPGIHD
jgi:hypothetical protein